MEKLSKKAIENLEYIKEKTGNSKSIIIKNFNFHDTEMYMVLSESVTDNAYINDFILKFFNAEKVNERNIRLSKNTNILEYLKKYITTQKTITVNNFSDLFYNIFCGFTIILIDGFDEALSIETRAQLDSGVLEAKNEVVVRGPKDAFTENYQTNVGLLRKRIKTEDLWLKETVVGTKSKTKVGILYVKGLASEELVNQINEKIEGISIDGIFDSNYIIELISENKKCSFANYISTERPDQVSMYLLEGRIGILVENTPYMVVVPAVFMDFFHNVEDYYQKVKNVNFNRIVRYLALIVSLLGPALYISLATYNIEVIPDKLLLSLAVQREGVPLPTIVETMGMILMFEITRETDSRLPSAFGNSLSIVGGIVLGQATIMAGLVSPTSIIVAGATIITGMVSYNIDMVGGIRLWRTIFLLFAAFLGMFGVVTAGLLFLINITSMKSFGIPYFMPFAPFYKQGLSNALLLTNKRKYEKRNPLISNVNRSNQGDSK